MPPLMRLNAAREGPVMLDGTPLEEVESFTCLRSIIDKKGSTDADVRARIGKARAAFLQLKNVWSSRELSQHTKVHIVNSNVKAVLL